MPDNKEFIEIPANTKVWSIKIQKNIYLDNPIYGEIAHTSYGNDIVFVQTMMQIFGTWVPDNSFGEISVNYSLVKRANRDNNQVQYFDFKYGEDLGKK